MSETISLDDNDNDGNDNGGNDNDGNDNDNFSTVILL